MQNRNINNIADPALELELLINYRGIMFIGGLLVFIWGKVFSDSFNLIIPYYIPIGLLCWLSGALSFISFTRKYSTLLYTLLCAVAITHQFYLLKINDFHYYIILSFNLAIIITTLPLYSLFTVGFFSISTLLFGLWHFLNLGHEKATVFFLSSSSFLIVIIYITWNKLSYLKQIQNAKAKSISSAKMAALGEMAGGIAHEINNPLAIIGASISLIDKQLTHSQNRDEKILNLLDKIRKTHERITKIIKGLRAFSGNSDKEEIQHVPLSTILDDILGLLEIRLKDSDIEFYFDETQWNITLKTYPIQLSQILLNILNNAIDEISELEIKKISLTCESDNQNVTFTISDSGPGVSPEIADKIFSPFFTTKPIGKGTGLGLSICKGLVEIQHGHIYLKSLKPATFVVTIPKK